MLIQVTDSHIKDGLARNCGKCPIALALIEALKGQDRFGEWQVAVRAQLDFLYAYRITAPGVRPVVHAARWSTPETVKRWIQNFDIWSDGRLLPDKGVDPGDFEIDAPDWYLLTNTDWENLI